MRSPMRGIRVGVRCDAGHGAGVGHAVRQLALAEELLHRGADVVHLGALDVPWLREAYADRGIANVAAPSTAEALTSTVGDLDLDAVLLDGYDLDPATGGRLRAAGRTVLAMVDDTFGAAQEADVYVDQNLGARPRSPIPPGASALAGIEYALFRDSVRERRSTTARPRATTGPVRVLAVFGGTDPFGAAPVLAPLVLDTALPVDLTVVAPDPDVRQHLAALELAPGQTLHAVGPMRDLPGAAVGADLVVSASGSSVWELLCLGVPTAAVCVVDNQEPGYAQTVEHGVVAGLGRLGDLRGGHTSEATDRVRWLLDDADERAALAARGRQLVDGDGRVRVADVLHRVLTTHGT